MPGSETTILILTKNRPGFVERAIKFYIAADFTGELLIFDSSDGENKNQVWDVTSTIGATPCHIRLHHRESGEYPIAKLLTEAGCLATRTYITLAGDDDFQNPAALEQAEIVLRDAPDVAGARGRRVYFGLEQPGIHGPLARAGYADFIPPFEQDTAIARLLSYAEFTYSVQYSSFRTRDWRLVHSYIQPPYLRYFSEEFMPCCLLLGMGKVVTLPPIGVVAQVGVGGGLWQTNTVFSLITHRQWPDFSQRFRGALAEVIARSNTIDMETATAQADRTLWQHLSLMLARQYRRFWEIQEMTVPLEARSCHLERLRQEQDFRLIEHVLSGGSEPPLTRTGDR